MKIEVFDLESLPAVKRIAGIVGIKIYATGSIIFNLKTIEALKLTIDTKVKILRNQDAPSEWFVAISVEDNAYTLNKNKSGFFIKNSTLARFLIDKISINTNIKPTTLTMRIGIDPIQTDSNYKLCYPILTRSQTEFIKKA